MNCMIKLGGGNLFLKKLSLFLVACNLLLTGCGTGSYDDSALWNTINSLSERVAIVETLLKAQHDGLFIRSVTPVDNGYTIVFSDNSQITISNGKDGIDGEDGTNGVIKVTQDDKNVYFELSDGSVIAIPKSGATAGTNPEVISFKDANVHDLCVKFWDMNGDGELSYAEAAAVKTIGQVFKGSEIVCFEELKYFTALTTIGSQAFSDCFRLVAIGIPENVVSIESDAFTGCGITSIHISDLKAWLQIKLDTTISWGYELYCDNKLVTNMVVPDGVVSIGDCALYGCRSLTSITIPGSVTEMGLLTNLSNLKSVHVSDLNAWLMMKINGNNRTAGFGGTRTVSYPCKYDLYVGDRLVTEVVVPNNIASIGDYVFCGCGSLKRVVISNGITKIGDYAFAYCDSLMSVTIPESITEIGTGAFVECLNLPNVVIPNSVTKIGTGAFYYCRNLTNIAISNSITKIENYTFQGCSSLTSVTIPERVVEIRACSFNSCSSLTSVTIPESVMEIWAGSFYYCSNLTDIYCKPVTPPCLLNGDGEIEIQAVTSMNYFCFPSNATIHVPIASVDAYKAAPGWEDYVSQIVGYEF